MRITIIYVFRHKKRAFPMFPLNIALRLAKKTGNFLWIWAFKIKIIIIIFPVILIIIIIITQICVRWKIKVTPKILKIIKKKNKTKLIV